MDDAVRGYVDAIPEDHRPQFERVSAPIAEAAPQAGAVPSYGMSTHRAFTGAVLGLWR